MFVIKKYGKYVEYFNITKFEYSDNYIMFNCEGINHIFNLCEIRDIVLIIRSKPCEVK